ncbi:S-layer homology domain-containing protein, partial [Oscillospiraceae bacterium OttesenSCG-928-G22]|nr:S-layer homology domain-containing protein [Oscillospiraceae bacterium OttesenSCG-928-G22]
MARRIKAIVSLLLAVILLSGFLPVPDFLPEAAAASSFSDVTNHWAKPAIERFAGLGVLKGVSGGRFHPDANITRAEFFAVLGRLFEVPGTASISQFSDVRSGDWFYADVQKAVKMGVTTGTSATTMSPREQISRQDACVMLGRSLGLFTDNTSHLSAFADRENISAYARGYVAAMVQNDYISGMPGGRFAPRDNLTRAQAVTIIDNMVSAVYGSEKSDFSNTTYTGTMLSNRAGMSLSNLTLNGNLILGDGVGTGDIAIRNSRINGKLIVRGGGPNSVDLTGTTVTGGIFVHNTNSVTRLVSSGSGSLGVLSARTGVTLEGPGFTSLIVQDDAENDAQYTLKNVSLESIDVNAPSRVTLDSRRVENFRINEGADGTRVQLDSGTTTSYMAINARNVSVTGTGTLSSLYVGAGGANVSMKPGTFSIADNVTATINGKAESGRVTSTADTNVDRSTSALRVTRYGSIGGSNAGLTFETSHSSSENRVRLTQSGTGTIVASSQKGRIAYWIAAFVPAPSGVSSSATIPTFQHAFDGLMSTSTNQKTTTSDGKTGLVIYLPVSRDDDDGYGYIDQSVYIRWNNTYRETLHFQANNLKLTALTTSQEESLVREFRNANFTGYHGEHYSGSEAIRRLLLTDNALGLSLRGFRTFAPGTQSNIAVQMNLVRDSFYTKEDIQSRLFVETSGKGALYAINRAMNAEQVKRILEDEGYADQLGIDARAGSKYYMLSQNGRLRVARAIILGRLGDYESEDKVKEVFDTNVDTIRIEETDLIVKINQTKSAEELQKLIENKANAAIIGIAVDVKPYSALTAADKLAVMRKIYSATPVSTLDRVRSIFLDMVGEPEEPGTDPGKPTDPKTISSVTTDKKTYEISRGQTITITPTVKTSDGQTYTDPSLVTWDYDGTNLTINSQGEATALSDVLKKTAVKVTVASTVNPAKKTTATVNIIPAIDAESLELRPSSLVEVTVGSKASITAILTPSNSNSTVTWSVDDENIASIASGMVTGKTPGFTTATAGIGALSLQASVPVAVLSAQPGVIIDRSTATIGVGEKLKLMAAVSPIGLSNRRISWSSSDTSVCSVASDGTVTGVAPANPEDVVRTATITAASVANPSLTATCVVTVDSSTKSITIVDEITMYAEERRVIPYSIFPVSAANEKVEWFITGGNTKGLELSTVGGTGDDADHAVVIAKSPGTYEISAQIRDTSVESRCKVVVSSTAMKLSLNKKALGMKIGDTEFLKVTFNPSTVYNSRVTWKSSHPEIASVDAEGKVTALKSGKATITAVSEAFPNYAVSELSCEVTVAKIPVTTFSLPETITVREEEVRKIEATILPENATNRTITWLRSPDEGKVIVHTDSGSIEGVQTTSRLVDKVVPDPTEQNPNQTKTIQVMEDFPVKITAICDDIERTCLVSVLPAGETIESINIELDNWVFPLGASPELVVKFFDKVDPATRQEIHPSNSILTWDSSSPDVIKFENNKLICSKPGIYAITATAYNGVYDTKYIAIGDTRIESLNVVGLNDYKGDYGNLLLLDMGPNSSKTLTVTPKQVTVDEKGLLWNVVAGDDVIKVDAKTGEVTALKPGVAKIVIKPIQEYGYGMAKPSDDNVVAQKYGAKTIFTPGSGAKNPNTDAVLADKLMPLLVETEILDGTDTIYVQVTETAPTDVTFTGHANATVGKPLTITGKPAPTHAGVANATWRLVDNGGGVLETSDVTETAYTRDGGTSYQFTPKKPGTVKLELTVTLAAWEGLTKNPTYDMLRVAGPHTKVDATTVTRELTFEVKPAAVDSIRITKPAGDTLYSDLSIYQGEYELNPEASKGSPITWSSSNSSVLSIHE